MYPWEVIGIEETDDKKVIKKAYAKLIRKHRPDEEPEKFQEVNQAYQFALNILKSQQPSDDVSSVSHEYPNSNTLEDVATQVSTEVTSEYSEGNANPDKARNGDSNIDVLSNDVVVETQDDFECDLANDILAQFHQMAFADYKSKKNKESWDFLNRYHEIQDLQLRDSLSKELFKRVAEYNFFQMKENSNLLLNQHVVTLIAEILDWESQWRDFELEFPQDYVQHVYGWIESKKKQKDGDHFYNRPFAILIELFMSMVFVGLIIQTSSTFDKEALIVTCFILFNCISSLSKLNISSLQYMFDYRLFDKYQNRPSLKLKIIRIVVFHLTMIPIYLIIYNAKFYFPLMVGVLGILLVINLICWFKNNQLFHDWISGTIMLK